MITVYTVAYNEEYQLQFMIDHYRFRFPDCHIVVYDNMSTDNTVDIALRNKCEVVSYDTNNQISDSKYLEIKNNCWKTAKTDWVLICDVDELVDINQDMLKYEETCNHTIINVHGYNMINMDDNCNLDHIKYGVRSHYYDKNYLFNKKFIKEINYQPGCHQSEPIGTINYSNNENGSYNAYHMNFINIDMSIEKYKSYAKRLSKENLDKGWGVHYLFSEDKIRAEFADLRSKAIRIRE
jgi:hypothetical protein